MSDEDGGARRSGTVFQPGAGSLPQPPRPAPARPDPDAPRLPPGTLLNDIYEVRRFLARGGMGEVYEGVNVITEERVAIKVMLGHLANDQHVQTMFLREARTLTRLNHPALVLYRVLAREKELDLVYIVTEFVDGISLDRLIGVKHPTEAELKALIRRLAEGLKAAHELGAIHRDISPDNILAPEGRLELAKVIDFGIAKDLVAGQGTIVGDGFAGKLGYVAPEQFGDFGRQIGPWTDVYSLGLVMLALMVGKPVDMGTTLVEAVDRRRAGPDLSALPPTLKPVFEQMLAADPQKRLRSMQAVLDALEPDAQPLASATRPPVTPPVPPEGQPQAKRRGGAALPLVLAGLVALAAAGAGAWYLMRNPPSLPWAKAGAGGAAATAKASPQALKIGPAVEAAVGQAGCGWLEYGPLTEGAGGRVGISLIGAAGDPDAAAGSVKSALEGAGYAVDFKPGAIKGFSGEACGVVNTLRATRASSSNGDVWMSAPQSVLIPSAHSECRNDPGYALAVTEGAIGPAGQDATLLLLSPDGQTRQVFAGEAGLPSLEARQSFVGAAKALDGRRFRVSLCVHDAGTYGLALVRGRGPFDLGLPAIDAPPGALTPDSFPDR
ncbi:MAG TPA: serine/threonine-protein kinase, partial [Caulobacteraceae bacterium]|nr:serine/threonine-protein kinase [Caulobacteraceae bacterium]